MVETMLWTDTWHTLTSTLLPESTLSELPNETLFLPLSTVELLMNETVMSSDLFVTNISTLYPSSTILESTNISEWLSTLEESITNFTESLPLETTLMISETYPTEMVSTYEASMNVSELFPTTEILATSLMPSWESINFTESFTLPTESFNVSEIFTAEAATNLSELFSSEFVSLSESSMNYTDVVSMEETLNVSELITEATVMSFLESATIEQTINISDFLPTSIMPSFQDTLSPLESSLELTMDVSELMPSSVWPSLEEFMNVSETFSVQSPSLEITPNISEVELSSILPTVENTLNLSNVYSLYGENTSLSEFVTTEMTESLSILFPSSILQSIEESLAPSSVLLFSPENISTTEFVSMETSANISYLLPSAMPPSEETAVSIFSLSAFISNIISSSAVQESLPYLSSLYPVSASLSHLDLSTSITLSPSSPKESTAVITPLVTKITEAAPRTSVTETAPRQPSITETPYPEATKPSSVSVTPAPGSVEPTAAMTELTTSIPSTTVSSVTTTVSPPTTTLPQEIDVNQMLVVIRPLFSQNVNAPEYKFLIQGGLLRAFLAVINGYTSEERRRKRSLPSMPMPPNPDNISTPVTRMAPDGRDVNVLFYAHNGSSNSVIPAEDVQDVYSQLDNTELSAYLGAMVRQEPRPYYYSEVDNRSALPLWLIIVILITVAVVIAIIITILVTWRKGMWGSKTDSTDFGDSEKKDILDAVTVQSPDKPIELTKTPVSTPFIFGARGPKLPPPYSAKDAGPSRTDSEKSKLGKKAKKHLKAEGDLDDSSDVNLKGYRRLSDDVTPLKAVPGDSRRTSFEYDNRAYQDSPDGDTETQGVKQPLLGSPVPAGAKKNKPERPKPPSALAKSASSRPPSIKKQPSLDSVSLTSMDSTPDYSAGLFEHVAKMSRISDTPPSDAESAPPPVRYLNTSETESIFPLGGPPLVSTFIPPPSQSDKSDTDLPVKKTVPVKLCRVHPLSNQPEPDESQSASNKQDFAAAAEEERQKNKQSHRDEEKVSDPPTDERKLTESDKPNADDDKKASDEEKPDEEDKGKHRHHEHRKHKHKKRSKSRDHSKHRERSKSRDGSKDRDPSAEHDDKRNKEPEKDHGNEEEIELEPVKESDQKKDRDQDKAREKKERKKQRKEEKQKAKQKKQEQEDLSKKSQDDVEVEKQYSSPSAKIMHDTRHQNWKKSPWQPPDKPSVEERKVGRNMRAAPLQRQSSETRSSSVSRRSSLKEQEFLQRLEQQRRIIAEREKLEQLAQQLINQAYLEKKSSAQQQRLHDAQTASCLLSDAFSLVQPVSEIPNYVHRSMASSPTPPAPGASDVESTTSAHTEPGFRHHRTVDGRLRRKQSSLEMLYAQGALTQLPLAGLQNSNLDTARTAWNASSGAISAVLRDHGQSQGNSILNEANGQLSSLSDKQRRALLTAVQEELHRLNAFS